MKRFIKRRPKASMIVAIIALVAAMAGSAVAGGNFLPKSKFKAFKSKVVKGPITYANTTQAVNTTTLPANSNGTTITAACPTGLHAVGGGVKSATNSGQSGLFVQQSYPSASGWTATVFAGFGPAPGTAEQITVTAVCEGGSSSGTPPSITP